MTKLIPSPRARFGIRFSMVARRWRREVEAALTRAGLTDATWAPMVHLDETGGGITQKHLAALVGVDASTLVRLLDILEQKGWIERRADEADGRSRRVYLTSSGLDQVRSIRERLEKTEAVFLEGIPDEEIVATIDFMDRLEERIILTHRSRTGGSQ